jgi:hypothetical protein
MLTKYPDFVHTTAYSGYLQPRSRRRDCRGIWSWRSAIPRTRVLGGGLGYQGIGATAQVGS